MTYAWQQRRPGRFQGPRQPGAGPLTMNTPTVAGCRRCPWPRLLRPAGQPATRHAARGRPPLQDERMSSPGGSPLRHRRRPRRQRPSWPDRSVHDDSDPSGQASRSATMATLVARPADESSPLRLESAGSNPDRHRSRVRACEDRLEFSWPHSSCLWLVQPPSQRGAAESGRPVRARRSMPAYLSRLTRAGQATSRQPRLQSRSQR